MPCSATRGAARATISWNSERHSASGRSRWMRRPGAKHTVHAALRAGPRSNERIPIGCRAQGFGLLEVANDLCGEEVCAEILKLTQALEHLFARIAGFRPDVFDPFSQRDEQIFGETYRFLLALHAAGDHIGVPLNGRPRAFRSTMMATKRSASNGTGQSRTASNTSVGW